MYGKVGRLRLFTYIVIYDIIILHDIIHSDDILLLFLVYTCVGWAQWTVADTYGNSSHRSTSKNNNNEKKIYHKRKASHRRRRLLLHYLYTHTAHSGSKVTDRISVRAGAAMATVTFSRRSHGAPKLGDERFPAFSCARVYLHGRIYTI